ncbi:MAG: HEAT repeat domain-containing protein, partial [Candidatus Omnitrophica bacterium]|nr:HEAT repeat domain-containing protein [Candidatus Omnitrophota bacterium]
ANRKQLLRNACVVLGNLGSEEALPTLKKALEEPSALVREHAHWAIDQIQDKKAEIIS